MLTSPQVLDEPFPGHSWSLSNSRISPGIWRGEGEADNSSAMAIYIYLHLWNQQQWQNTESQDLEGQVILSVLAPPAVCKLFQEWHTAACHVDGDRGMNGCHSLRAEILLKVTEVNDNSPSSPGSCKHSTDSSIPNIIILDRFCHCSYCLGGKTPTWCLLLCRLPRILPSNI